MKLPLKFARAIEIPPDIKLAGMIGYDVLMRALLVVPAAIDLAAGMSGVEGRRSAKLAGQPLRPLPEESDLHWHPLMIVRPRFQDSLMCTHVRELLRANSLYD